MLPACPASRGDTNLRDNYSWCMQQLLQEANARPVRIGGALWVWVGGWGAGGCLAVTSVLRTRLDAARRTGAALVHTAYAATMHPAPTDAATGHFWLVMCAGLGLIPFQEPPALPFLSLPCSCPLPLTPHLTKLYLTTSLKVVLSSTSPYHFE